MYYSICATTTAIQKDYIAKLHLLSDINSTEIKLLLKNNNREDVAARIEELWFANKLIVTKLIKLEG